MRVVIIYRPNSEHERLVEQFVRDFEHRYRSRDEHLELLNIDTRDGSATATLYDVMSYPAILVLQNDGYLQKSWEGAEFPLIDEIISYARA